jgi:magnesium-transporting ATPase (P-type)
MARRTDEYAHERIDETAHELQVDPVRGLSDREARARLDRYGYTQLEEKEESLCHRILRRFWGPIPWMIETAAILSAVVQKWEDFAIILVMLLVNAGLDFFQEHRALNKYRIVDILQKAGHIVAMVLSAQGIRLLGRDDSHSPIPEAHHRGAQHALPHARRRVVLAATLAGAAAVRRDLRH